MSSIGSISLTSAAVGVGFLAMAATQAVATPVLMPGSGHYYERIAGTYNWHQARANAATRSHLGMQGYLASLSSAAEAHFVKSTFIDGKFAAIHEGPWVGGWQSARATGAFDGWRWISGEPFGPAGWAVGEPNDHKGVNEEAIHFMRELGWNDRPSSMTVSGGYIVEYGAPSGYTLANPAPAGEVSIDGPGSIIEQIQLMDNITLVRVSDDLDAKWALHAGSNPVNARARFGAGAIEFGILPDFASGAEDFIALLEAPSGNGILPIGSGPSTDLEGVIPEGDYFPLAIRDENGNVLSSLAAFNGCDRMMTWVDANDPTHYFVAFEGADCGTATGDFNTLVIELDNVIDGPLDYVPEPGTLALFGLGLATMIYRRRRAA
jgi:hypothetical protein